MPETRFLPKKELRSTGLARTTMTGSPPTTAGSNASSPVSAAPGVARNVHQHVVNARNPGAPPANTPSRRAQDAKVQIVERRQIGAGGRPIAAGGGPSFHTRVELMDRPPPAGAAAPAGGQLPAGPAGAPFTLDEALLIAGVFEKYRDNAFAAGDGQVAGTCQSILDKLTRLYSPAARAVNLHAASSASRPTAAPAPGVVDDEAPVAAHTTTEIFDHRTGAGTADPANAIDVEHHEVNLGHAPDPA